MELLTSEAGGHSAWHLGLAQEDLQESIVAELQCLVGLGHRLEDDSVKHSGLVSAGPAGPVPDLNLLCSVIQAPCPLPWLGLNFSICTQEEGRRGLNWTPECPRSGGPDLQLCGRSLSGQEVNFRVGDDA